MQHIFVIGLFKIGVHIADVSYFVQEQTPLDNEAAQRTTSVYLVERVRKNNRHLNHFTKKIV